MSHSIWEPLGRSVLTTFSLLKNFLLNLYTFLIQCQKCNNNPKTINVDLLAVCFSPGGITTMHSGKEKGRLVYNLKLSERDGFPKSYRHRICQWHTSTKLAINSPFEIWNSLFPMPPLPLLFQVMFPHSTTSHLKFLAILHRMLRTVFTPLDQCYGWAFLEWLVIFSWKNMVPLLPSEREALQM